MGTKFVIVADGDFLYSYDIGWLTEHRDDPSCWTSDRSKAIEFKSRSAAEKLIDKNGCCGFQAGAKVEEIQS